MLLNSASLSRLEEEEKKFIQRLKNSKTQNQAFEELVSSYQKKLYDHIRQIVLGHEDTHDVLQNTFIKIFNHIEHFQEDSKLFTWMYRIATNESLNFLKSKATKFGLTTEALQEHMVADLVTDDLYSGDEIAHKLQMAIAKLPEKQQLVFKMKYFEELKYEEISQILETSVGALKASYHHAVKKIELLLEDH